MIDDHRKMLNIIDSNNLLRTGSKSEQRKGKDTDIYLYDEVDADGTVVAKYEVKESMSIYPPFATTKSFSKTELN